MSGYEFLNFCLHLWRAFSEVDASTVVSEVMTVGRAVHQEVELLLNTTQSSEQLSWQSSSTKIEITPQQSPVNQKT